MSCWALDCAGALGPFVVGMSLNEALEKIKSAGELESAAELVFDDSKMFASHVSIFIPDMHMQLLFDGTSQTLTSITANVTDDSRLTIPGGQDLKKVLSALPPTTLGTYEGPSYHLEWPGLGMSFDLSDLGKGEISRYKSNSEHPMGQNYSPPCRRFWLTPRTESTEPGNFLKLSPGTVSSSAGWVLKLGDTRPQDVLAELGVEPENEIYTSSGELVWRYFSRGLRLVFSAESAALERVFIFNNLPNHEDSFGVFSRCPWKIDELDNTMLFSTIFDTLGPCQPSLVLPSGLHLRSYPSLGFMFECVSPNGAIAALQVCTPN